MVQIKIKAINEQYTVVCYYDDFSTFLSVLKERLMICARSHLGSFEAFFVMQKKLEEEELWQLLMTAREAHTIIMGINVEKHVMDMQILREHLHRGRTYVFHRPLLLLGAIDVDVFVQSSENMYCIGQVRGNVDLLHEDCTLVASSLFQANIRICDAKYHNLTSFSPAQVYYQDSVVQIQEYEEEKAWDVQ